ncbi:MAG: carboxymuconolactone decarboxylase family protein [Planctomycetota bacterium]
MTLEQIRERLPAHAKDLKLNLALLERGTKLDPLQLWGTAVASALAARNADLSRAIVAEARAHLSAAELEAARTAAALMAMNNVYYRFTHLVSDEEYERLPARLRMQGIATHGVDPVAFELWSIAVSAVNGCGRCIDSHERVLREKGASREHVQDAVRLAAVIAATAAVLDAERALATQTA